MKHKTQLDRIKEIRKPTLPKPIIHKDKKKYNRSKKHKGEIEE